MYAQYLESESEDEFDYGTHETLVLSDDNDDDGGDVAELELMKRKCTKPHENYIKVNEITESMLPEDYREPELFKLINAMAALTVKIDVKYISKDRPTNWQGKENSMYPGYNKKGQNAISSGSGRIADVYQDPKEDIRCLCMECKSSTIGERENWILLVFTATHVVYDDNEAEKSACQVFYDNKEGGDKSFQITKKLWANEAGDLCLLAGATCDRGLALKLKEVIKEFNALWQNIHKNYEENKELKNKNRLVVIVSHPHGQTKKISFSRLKSEKRKRIESDQGLFFTYNACTCAGSSGAPVYVYGQDWFKDETVHSGSNMQVNYSTVWCSNE